MSYLKHPRPHKAAARQAETAPAPQEGTQDPPCLSQDQQGPQSSLFNHYEEKVRPCIDLIDSLRALGVEQDLALPAIAVIGDQSSGKSSVLEALSGVALPRGSGIVTRCPLVLKLKKQLQGAPWRGTLSYRTVVLSLQDPSRVESEINKAQNTIAGHGVGISHELITLEITSPEVPDLTLIDLPGITRLAVGNQPPDIGVQIKNLIKMYIQRQETINLVVVPCNVDIATTEALSMAREVDPDGDRTLGILTKPDLVDKGAEKNVLNVAQNHVFPLKKGYMIVKCRGQQDIMNKQSLAKATEKEISFFQTHPHFRALLENGKATVPRLAEKLTAELISHITKSLPLLDNTIRESYQQATEELRQCGSSIPTSESHKLLFLIEKIKGFNRDIEKLIEGEETVKAKEIRLCNRVRKEFNKWELILQDHRQKVKTIVHKEVSQYEEQYRGKELPGFASYKTFEAIVQQYVSQLVEPALTMLHNVAEMIELSFIDTAKERFGDFLNLHQVVQSKIKSITQKQVGAAENLIRLQFSMEQLVYCDDSIYGLVLSKVREETFSPAVQTFASLQGAHPSKAKSPISSFTEIGVHMTAYFLETSNRLSNQIPLIIQYFVLKESSEDLQGVMLQVLHEREHYSWLLEEHSETAKKRIFLTEKIDRLAQARQALYNFSSSRG
ncbi:interferon-induced GTP-binding protein Mx2 [Talpa occidentalis]|uniref:interferon-induced GTP-binding protein Mx2 n=1 Tax=Talpa occidentalis TaxID=50954 RepID=UPI00188F82EA|nr:interferon-induced GTP-binding protein Mx2 [Talpa occidentalis]